jgi:leucyl aminopeptidase
MRLNVETRLPWDIEADVLAVAIPAGAAMPEYLSEIDRRLGGGLEEMRKLGAIKGKLWEARLIPAQDMGVRFVLAVGVGDGSSIDRLGARRLGAVIVRRLTGCDVRTLAVHVPDDLVGRGETTQAAIVEMVTRGLVEGAAEPSTIYRDADDRLPPAFDECTFAVESGDVVSLLARAERGHIIGEGGNRTRRLAQRAGNDVSPEVLADEASDVARQFDMELTVLGPEEAAEMGMGMFMAVGRGSSNQPRFIALRTKPSVKRDQRDRLLAMVGKGVTFDTGGISLKPPPNMGEMKTDKTGACTVIHAIATAAQLAPELPLLAVAPAVENMPGPHSSRPGDVIRALNGKSVEITNTDAEGRLILGDALAYACKRVKPTAIIDVATLTGGVVVALGSWSAGLWCGDDELRGRLEASARTTGEKVWPMPLWPEHRDFMRAKHADVWNSGPKRDGHPIQGAAFLSFFVDEDLPWAHLDIAGVSSVDGDSGMFVAGPTGFGVRLLTDVVAGYAT